MKEKIKEQWNKLKKQQLEYVKKYNSLRSKNSKKEVYKTIADYELKLYDLTTKK